MLRRCVVAVLIALYLLAPRVAFSTDVTPKVVVIDGKKGLFFTKEQGEKILVSLEKVPKLEALVESQRKLIATQKTAIRTSSATIDLQLKLDAAQEARHQDIIAAGRQCEAREAKLSSELDSWYRQPQWPFLIGVGSTFALITATFIISK